MDELNTTLYTQGYNTYTNQASEKLKKTLSEKNYANATDEEMMEVAKSFESYLMEQVLKAMERTTKLDPDEETDSTGYLSMFKDQLTQEYAKLTSENTDLGLAKMLYEQMKLNNSPIVPEKVAEIKSDDQTTVETTEEAGATSIN